MAATLIDSTIFGNIFSTDAMRAVWSDENRTARTSTSSARSPSCRDGSASSRGGGRRDRPQLRHRQDRHGEAARRDRAHRLSGSRRRVAVERALPRQAGRVLSLGRDHAGHHRHAHRAADPRRPRARRCRSRRDFNVARGTRAPLPRHADHRAQQSAAGDPDDLRLQDGRDPRRHRASPRAARAAASARAGRRIRRRLRHARVDRDVARWKRSAP